MNLLLGPYKLYCDTHSVQATVAGYYNWSNAATNPVYAVTRDINLIFVMALFLYRCDVRRNESVSAMAGLIFTGPT